MDEPAPAGGSTSSKADFEGSVRAGVMAEALAVAGDLPTPQPRSVLCPFCGSVTPGADRCASCKGYFDPLSRQATQNHMGPWFVRDERSPHRPGCTFETITRLIDSGQITLDTVIRGPSTRQFWMLARHTPGIAHRLGACHNCRTPVGKDAFQCPSCHAAFTTDRDRQHLGLGPARPLPGQGPPEVLAMQAGPAHVAGGGWMKNVTSGALTGGAETPPSAEAATSAEEMVGHARSRVARYREEARKDRQRGVIALVLASLVVLMSLVYVGLVVSRPGTASGAASAEAGTTNLMSDRAGLDSVGG